MFLIKKGRFKLLEFLDSFIRSYGVDALQNSYDIFQPQLGKYILTNINYLHAAMNNKLTYPLRIRP